MSIYCRSKKRTHCCSENLQLSLKNLVLQRSLDHVCYCPLFVAAYFTSSVIKLIVFSDDERHDVYLTLLQGVFSKGSKRADKNVEVVVEMLGDDDNPITMVSLFSHDCHMINFRNVSNLGLERIMFLCTHHLSIIIWPHLFLTRQSR